MVAPRALDDGSIMLGGDKAWFRTVVIVIGLGSRCCTTAGAASAFRFGVRISQSLTWSSLPGHWQWPGEALFGMKLLECH
jgi:hypothetical protein